MKHFVAVAPAVVLAVALCGVVGAHQTVVVRVTEPGLRKAAVTVDAGDMVVWANVSAAHLTISFSGGKELSLLCGVPTRFYVGSDDTFTSGVIPPGAVASLCFAEPGVYQYTIAGTNQGRVLKGMVTVK
jgi:plastocyanin